MPVTSEDLKMQQFARVLKDGVILPVVLDGDQHSPIEPYLTTGIDGMNGLECGITHPGARRHEIRD